MHKLAYRLLSRDQTTINLRSTGALRSLYIRLVVFDIDGLRSREAGRSGLDDGATMSCLHQILGQLSKFERLGS